MEILTSTAIGSQLKRQSANDYLQELYRAKRHKDKSFDFQALLDKEMEKLNERQCKTNQARRYKIPIEAINKRAEVIAQQGSLCGERVAFCIGVGLILKSSEEIKPARKFNSKNHKQIEREEMQ